MVDDAPMSTRTRIPAWTLGWRLKRSLAMTDYNAQTIGERLGRKRGAISDWMNDHGAPPADAFLHRWAELCSVDYEWLVTGAGSVNEPMRRTTPRDRLDVRADAAFDAWEAAEPSTPCGKQRHEGVTDRSLSVTYGRRSPRP